MIALCLDTALVTEVTGAASVIGTGSVETPVKLEGNHRSFFLRKKNLFTEKSVASMITNRYICLQLEEFDQKLMIHILR